MPDERDRRARARDDAAAKRDIDAAIRDRLADTDTASSRLIARRATGWALRRQSRPGQRPVEDDDGMAGEMDAIAV